MPVDTNEYLRDVLGPALEQFRRDGTLPGAFARYFVPFETDDERLVAARITEVKQIWQRNKQHAKYGALVTALIRDDSQASALLRSGPTREKVRREESARTALKFQEIDELVRRVESRGNPREEDIIAIVQYFGGRFDAATVRGRFREPFLRSLAAFIAEPLSDQRYAEITTALGVLKHPTYYRFLGLPPGAKDPDIVNAVARKAADIRKGAADEGKAAAERLVQYAGCLTDGRPSSYDRTRYAMAAKQIATAAQLLAKGTANGIIADDAAYLTAKTAKAYEFSTQEASELVVAVLADRGIRLEASVASQSTPTAGDEARARAAEQRRQEEQRAEASSRHADARQHEEAESRRRQQRDRDHQQAEEQRQGEARRRQQHQQAEERRSPVTGAAEEREKRPNEKHSPTATRIGIGTKVLLTLLVLFALWTSPWWMRELGYLIRSPAGWLAALALVITATAWRYRSRRLWPWMSLILLVAAGMAAVRSGLGDAFALGGLAQPLAEVMIALGVPPSAVERFGVAADIRRGILLIDEGENGAGAQSLYAAMRIAPNDPAVSLGLGMLAARQGNDSLAALKYTDATRSANPRITELALHEMAYVHFRRKHFAEAATAFSQLRALGVSTQRDRKYEGCSLRALGREAESVAIFRAYGTVYPGNCLKLKVVGPPGAFDTPE